jgi:hypothetical protein
VETDTDTTGNYAKVLHHRGKVKHKRARPSPSAASGSNSGGAQYKFFLVLLFLLAVSSVVGLIFVPLGDRIAKRYSWYTYESKVTTLIVTFGLAAGSGLVLTLLLLTQLNQLKKSEGNAFIVVLIVIGFIFSLISLICSLVQHSNPESVFGEEFEILIPVCRAPFSTFPFHF